MVRLEMNNYNIALTEKQQIETLNQKQIKKQTKFSYSSLGKAFEKQTEKHVDIKSLDASNKLKQVEGIFLQNLMRSLSHAKLKEIIESMNSKYKLKRRKAQTFGKYSLPIAFLKDVSEGYLSLENADFKQSNFPIELKNFEKNTKIFLKCLF